MEVIRMTGFIRVAALTPTNAAVLITKTGEHETRLLSKEELAKVILEKAAEML